MSEIKVGDRVRSLLNGREGRVTAVTCKTPPAALVRWVTEGRETWALSSSLEVVHREKTWDQKVQERASAILSTIVDRAPGAARGSEMEKERLEEWCWERALEEMYEEAVEAGESD